MSKLAQRLERLEAGGATPAEARRAAQEFVQLLDQLASRFAAEDGALTEREQLDRWSPAQRTAWRMRFRGEPWEKALAAIGRTLPRSALAIVHENISPVDERL